MQSFSGRREAAEDIERFTIANEVVQERMRPPKGGRMNLRQSKTPETTIDQAFLTEDVDGALHCCHDNFLKRKKYKITTTESLILAQDER